MRSVLARTRSRRAKGRVPDQWGQPAYGSDQVIHGSRSMTDDEPDQTLAGIGACARRAARPAHPGRRTRRAPARRRCDTRASRTARSTAGLAPEISTDHAAVVDARLHPRSVESRARRADRATTPVFTYIDRDGNAAHRRASTSSAEPTIVVATARRRAEPTIRRCSARGTASQFTFTDPTPVGPAPTLGGFSANVNASGSARHDDRRPRRRTIWRGQLRLHRPGAGARGASIPLAVNYSTAAPPPPPPPPPAPTPVPTPVADSRPAAERAGRRRTGGLHGPERQGPHARRGRVAAVQRGLRGRVLRRQALLEQRAQGPRHRHLARDRGARRPSASKLIVSKGRKRARARASAVSPGRLDQLERPRRTRPLR